MLPFRIFRIKQGNLTRLTLTRIYPFPVNEINVCSLLCNLVEVFVMQQLTRPDQLSMNSHYYNTAVVFMLVKIILHYVCYFS